LHTVLKTAPTPIPAGVGLPIEKRMERLFLGITVTRITLFAMALILMFILR
jgi:hypothetical protein